MIEKQSRLDQIAEILKKVKYPEYNFVVSEYMQNITVHAWYMEPDTVTGKVEMQKTREWVIDPEWDENQIVQTAFKCVLASHEHRVREFFLWKGKPIFGPHFDIQKLWNICDERQQDAWKNGK